MWNRKRSVTGFFLLASFPLEHLPTVCGSCCAPVCQHLDLLSSHGWADSTIVWVSVVSISSRASFMFRSMFQVTAFFFSTVFLHISSPGFSFDCFSEGYWDFISGRPQGNIHLVGHFVGYVWLHSRYPVTTVAIWKEEMLAVTGHCVPLFSTLRFVDRKRTSGTVCTGLHFLGVNLSWQLKLNHTPGTWHYLTKLW